MRRHAYLLAFFIATIRFLLPVSLAAAQAATLTIDADQQFQFAQYLYDRGQFQRAAEEFDRLVFFFPDDDRVRPAILSAGHSFLRAGDSETALQHFSRLTNDNQLDDIAVDAYFLAAECQLRLSGPNQAILQLHNLIVLTDEERIKDNARLRIAWIQIEQTDWPGALGTLERISAEGRQRLKIRRLEDKLSASSQIPRKNPVLAGTLSIVPGTGQLYCGRYQDALAALIVNGGLVWAAYESFDNDLNALGGLLTLAGLGFYTANIYGAVSSAHKFNRRQRLDFIQQIKQHMAISIGALPAPDGGVAPSIAMTFHYRF